VHEDSQERTKKGMGPKTTPKSDREEGIVRIAEGLRSLSRPRDRDQGCKTEQKKTSTGFEKTIIRNKQKTEGR